MQGSLLGRAPALGAVPTAAQVHPSWRPLVDAFWQSDAGVGLAAFLDRRLREGAVVYPPQPLRALALTPLDEVRVVVVGQDPYHGPGQAEGLAFSVAPGVRIPPSLRNIRKEVWRELGSADAPMPPVSDGSLVRWAEQGVLLINSCLTVEDGLPASHADKGWEALLRMVLRACVDRPHLVFMLWGAHAQSLLPASDTDKHLVLRSNHPSPLSASRGPVPFLGNGHFAAANAWLEKLGLAPVSWLDTSGKTVA